MAAPPISERHKHHFHRQSPIKESVRAATTANITIATALNNGDSLDGVTLATDDRVLVKDQSTGSQNGIYVVGASPARDYDESTDDPGYGFLVYVREGTLNGATAWVNTNTTTPTIGSTALTFAALSGGSSSTVFYNVQDYGAVGDGTTDDTTAITATFTASDATGGGVIYFPPTANYYKLTTLITLTASSKYHLLGGGTRYGPARVHQATANTGAFRFNPSGGTAERVLAPIVENLTISGAGGASSGNGLTFDNDGHMEGVLVYGFYVGAKFQTASFYSVIRNSTFTDCDFAGVHLSSTNNTTIDSCRFTGAFGGAAPIGTLVNGIVVTTGYAQRILNCSIEYFTQYGIAVEGGGPIEIIGNYFETQQSTTGFAHVWLGNTSTTYDAWLTSNYFQGDGTAGFNAIKLDNAVAFHILGNRFGNNAAIGIAHTGGSSLGFAWGNTNSPAGTFTLPSDTITSPGGAAFATPAVVLGTAAAAGAATTVIRSDSTIAAFDATVPVTQALGDSAATGSAAFAARRDHKHGMPALSSATPLIESGSGSVGTAVPSSREDHVHPASAGTGVGAILISDTPSTPLVFADLIQNEAQNDLVYADT